MKEGFTDSLLGSTSVASLPHPERKSVLLDANALLLTDIPAGARFTTGIHMRSYVFDAKNSSFESVRNSADQSSFVVSAHYQNPRATLPPAPTATPSPNPFPRFTTLPDGRSLFLGYTYNFAKLPEPMAARRADPRVGHFDSQVWDFSSDAKFTAKTHYVNRWRLEQKDPGATPSEPKEPIVFWIDRTVPETYRAAVRDGILEWNKAFEAAGFKDAIVVRQQDPDGTVDTFDARHSTVRWFVSTDAGFAIGPTTVDPRTGEILNAQVAIPEAWSRIQRTFITEQAPSAWPAFDAYKASLGLDGSHCTFAAEALAELQFGLELLAERGEIDPGSPEADAFVNASLKAVVMHEVGHTLGLRHNFRASTVYPLAKLADPAWTRDHGICRLGDGLHSDQHRGERRSAGCVFRADDRPVRLLGDRVRVSPAAKADRERRARADRRTRCDRSAARVLVRRGSDRGPRPRREPVRPGLRPAALPAEDGSCSRGSCGSGCRRRHSSRGNRTTSCGAASMPASGRSAALPHKRRNTSAGSITSATFPERRTCR